MKEIKELRREIDIVSREICDLLLKRKKLAERILKIKEKTGLVIHDPDREQELLDILTKNQKKSDQDYLKAVLQTIFTEMRRTR